MEPAKASRRPATPQHRAELEVRWVQGFTKRKLGFVNNKTICYPCGNYVIFINFETKARTILRCKNGSVGAFAVNGNQGMIAFSDRQMEPTIYVYACPEPRKRAKLKGQAGLDYSLLAFSHTGSYLASYSSIPEFSLSIWDWSKKTLLCSQSQPGVDVTMMSFNPMSWHQLCLSSGTSVTLWNIERSDNEHLLKSKPVILPAQDGSTINEQNDFFCFIHGHDPYFGPVLPNSAVAGLVGDEAETFKPKDDTQPTVHPTVHCWTPTSDLYMGCEEGYFLKIGADTFKAITVHQKLSPDAKAKLRATFRSLSHYSEKSQDDERPEIQNVILFAMALHKDGLYAAGSDGVVRCYQVKGTQFQAEDCLEVEDPITNLIFSPDYSYLLVETEKGSLYIFNPNDNEDVILLLDASEGQFLGVDFVVPGSEHCVSVAESGELHIWQTENGACVSKVSLHVAATAMACSLSSHCVAVGTKRGYIFFINVADVKRPKVVHRVLVTEFPVQFLHYEQSGQFLIIGASDGCVFILNALPSTSFQVLGYIALCQAIIDLTSLYDVEKETSEIIVLFRDPDTKRAKLEVFSLPEKIISDNEECISERGMLKDQVIWKRTYDLDCPLSSVVKRKDTTVYGYDSHAPFICKYHFASKISWKDSPVLTSEKRIPSKQFGRAFLRLSPHGKWLASVAESGVLIIHDAATLDTLVHEHCHSYHEHGIRSMAFSLNGQLILVSGADGAIVLLKWKRISERKLRDAADFGNYLLSNLNNYIFQENRFLAKMPEWTTISGISSESSLFQSDSQTKFKKRSIVEIGEEDELFLLTQEKFSEATWVDQKTRKAIEEETAKFSGKRNEVKQGIKKLRKKIQEMMFENAKVPNIEKLDQQEFDLDIEEQERQQIESEKEVTRIRKDIELENLANAYLREIIKKDCWDAMSVKGRSVRGFHLSCEIQNYPMKERSHEELAFLKKILHMKKIEKADLKLRRDIVDFESHAPVTKEEGEKTEEGEKQDEEAIDALEGSLSSHFGADTSLLYSQMEMHTREEKINQIILLRDVIYNVKTAFNNEFDSVSRMKELEIARVKERNVRISEILKQLEIQEEIWEPTLTNNETPERDLIVLDSEIKVEKYLTPVQKAKEKIMSRINYKRRLAAMGDRARERGLMDMMNGVLEVKKEDILKLEIPPPPFAAKVESLWNEDEKKVYKEYEKKVKELNEEREKYRKIQETELRKLQSSVQETTQAFDEILNRLFEKKVKSEMIIYQMLTGDAVKVARAQVDAFREAYDIFVAEDKLMERGFRKEFSDVPTHHIDQLFKLYKRRPRALKTKVVHDTANPYGDRPGSVKAFQDAYVHLMKAIDEMDEFENKPEGIDYTVWERFCVSRRAKAESEQQIKHKALTLAEMQTFLQKRNEDDENSRKDIEQIFSELNILREMKMKFQLDLMVQFLFKQGQVELDGINLIPDYTDAILINRSIVEDLNSTIRAQGERKVASMVESKDFRKGIFQLEWDHKKIQMQIDDLNQKARDIQKLNVTKDRQLFLTVMNYDSRMNREVSVMEATLTYLDKVHKKNVQQQKKYANELEKQIDQKKVSNLKLSKEICEMLVSVSERRHIFETSDSEQLKQKIHKERYEDILQRQQLVELAKAQAQELSLLQAEVERLRLKTFPAFFNVQEY
ncbi:cilia- and flagella-associated protein 43 isoform X2 [Sphaerodactylus townsendi]|uniref:cilia- and flagella-associated protein 43 isoform X2 n=1 Tax=Sphaerodactylus townsendi TaxID=933632 RepID=UPI0020273F11|nr:cilia- and flagella-associated protein 43 isoform X2 [Sphaerodactylus townsendi]